MDSRAPVRIATLLVAALAAFGCDRGGSEPAASASASGEPEAQAPASQPGAAESAGLVGTDVEVEAKEVETVGPPTPTIVFTAGIKGYTEPCGCTLDILLGGIDRVVGSAAAVVARNETALVLDAGNLLFEYPEIDPAARAQELRKTQVIVQALAAMGTRATTPGPTDFAAGVDFYLETLGGTDVEIVASNVVLAGGAPLALPWTTAELGSLTIGVVGAAAPEAFLGVEGVEVLDIGDTVPQAVAGARDAGADAVVLLFQGDHAQAQRHLGEVNGIDFVIIGQPRETDEVGVVAGAHVLEAYDQGRYLGRLKLMTNDVEGADGWVNASAASGDEIARLQRVIANTEEQLAALPSFDEAAGEAVPPIVQSLRDRVTRLQGELDAAQAATDDFERGPRVFHFTPIPMEPGLPTDPALTEAMRAYNRELRAINLADAEPPVPAVDGQPHYVGVEACATCHPAAAAFWETTQHAHAIDTLIEREKEFDHACIGCHVTGYREPGGSALAEWRGLENVQCEQCHGPGSFHAQAPTEWVNVPGGVHTAATEATCVGCHNEEHSTTFDFATYLPRTLGPGHGG